VLISNFPFFLKPSSEVRIDMAPQIKVKTNGIQCVEAWGINFCKACQAAVIAPVIKAIFVKDWIVKK